MTNCSFILSLSITSNFSCLSLNSCSTLKYHANVTPCPRITTLGTSWANTSQNLKCSSLYCSGVYCWSSSSRRRVPDIDIYIIVSIDSTPNGTYMLYRRDDNQNFWESGFRITRHRLNVKKASCKLRHMSMNQWSREKTTNSRIKAHRASIMRVLFKRPINLIFFWSFFLLSSLTKVNVVAFLF